MIKEEARRILMSLLIAYDNCEHGDYFYEYGNEVCEAVECLLSKSDVPVVYGRWVHNDEYVLWAERYICSVCNCNAPSDGDYRHNLSNYCPNCGAKMDGEEQSQKTPIKTLRCVYAESAKENEIGEELVWCERTGRWMNVSLGECYGQCESQAAEVDGE